MNTSTILFLAFIGPFFGGFVGVSLFTVHLMILAKKSSDKKLDIEDIQLRGIVTVAIYALIVIGAAIFMNLF